MNKFLSDSLYFVNALCAFLIILGSGLVAMGSAKENETLAFVLGIAGGTSVSILICGSLAVLLSIKDELVLLNKSMSEVEKN